MKLHKKFADPWQEDFYRSQLRFLPEPARDPDCLGKEPWILQRPGNYWAILYVTRGSWLRRLRRHPQAQLLWISEKDHFCFAFPSILIDNV